jgi:hypothetical protein
MRPVVRIALRSMGIKVVDRKLLWGRSGNRCAFESCSQELINTFQGGGSQPFVIGEEAHIVAETDDGPRAASEMPQNQRDSYPNLILLCPTHHTLVDKDEAAWSVERLLEMKKSHEVEVAPDLDAAALIADEAWAGLVDTLSAMLDLTNWGFHFSGFVSANQGTWYSSLEIIYNTSAWLNARVFPVGHTDLQRAFETLKLVLVDLAETFERHSEAHAASGDDYFVRTAKFYKGTGFPNPRYHEQAAEYDVHVNLVTDLALEATRSGNWLCELVRRDIDPVFMIGTGNLQLLGGPFEDGVERWLLPVYSVEDTSGASLPYSGIENFSTLRYERDLHTSPPDA